MRNKTDIYLVPDFQAALRLTQELGAEAVGWDMEGVLGNFVGNRPYGGMLDDFMSGRGKVNMALARTAAQDFPDVAFGIATNNLNQPNKETGGEGLVTQVAETLGMAGIHKGMQTVKGALRAKPSGEQMRHFCNIADAAPERTVLVDDQGVKNAGEAVWAGLGALIVPDPIGLPRGTRGRVEEHKWVRRGRRVEPRIYSSLAVRGRLARAAYGHIAGIDIDAIGEFHDLRGA